MTVPAADASWFQFSVAGEELAVPGSVVREVASGGRIEGDDGAPAEALGSLTTPGGRVPVIDLASHLELGSEVPSWPYVVVVRAADRWIGLPATAVHGLVSLPLKGMRPLPAAAGSNASREILGAHPWKDGWLMLLDVDQLVHGAGG